MGAILQQNLSSLELEFKDMFLNLTAADDLNLRYGVDAPTLRIEAMTLAGT